MQFRVLFDCWCFRLLTRIYPCRDVAVTEIVHAWRNVQGRSFQADIHEVFRRPLGSLDWSSMLVRRRSTYCESRSKLPGNPRQEWGQPGDCSGAESDERERETDRKCWYRSNEDENENLWEKWETRDTLYCVREKEHHSGSQASPTRPTHVKVKKLGWLEAVAWDRVRRVSISLPNDELHNL
jgi:hypothetical protein